MRLHRRILLFSTAVIAAAFVVVYFYPEINDYFYSNFGASDVITTVRIIKADGSVITLRTGGDTVHYLGKEVKENDLIALLNKQVSKFHDFDDPWRNKRYWREKYRLDLETDLLIQSNSQQITPLLIKLLNDPLFTDFAIARLIEMRDEMACPFILAAWNNSNKNDDNFVIAFRIFPYKAAIPKVIDTLRETYEAQDPEYVLTTIEKTTGESLEAFRYKRNSTPAEVREMKGELVSWWTQYLSKHPLDNVSLPMPSKVFDSLNEALTFVDQKLDKEDWKGLEDALYPPLREDEPNRTWWQQLKEDRGQGRLNAIFSELHFPSEDGMYEYPYDRDVYALGANNNADSKLKGLSRITFLKTKAGWCLKAVSRN